MRSISSLIHKLKTDFPAYSFVQDSYFSWSPSTTTIHFSPKLNNAGALVLHELSHALLDHHGYESDVSLLAMESAAWEKARELAETYSVKVTEPVVQDHLDTYRDWMHARSTCPACTATGYQVKASLYTCPACQHEWRVNEARLCGLKRYKATSPRPR